MLKEYVIQIDSATTRQHAKIQCACKAIAKEYEGDFYVKIIDKDHTPGKLKLVNTNKGRVPFWNVKGL